MTKFDFTIGSKWKTREGRLVVVIDDLGSFVAVDHGSGLKDISLRGFHYPDGRLIAGSSDMDIVEPWSDDQSLPPLLLTSKEIAMGAAEQETELRRIFAEEDPLAFKSKRQATEEPVDDDAEKLDAHMISFHFQNVCLSPESRVPGYLELERVLCAAYEQASAGKGKERHAAGDNFNAQPILTIGRLLKSADGEAYQAIKKTREALMMHRRGNTDAAIRELLGAINYLAAVAILVSEEGFARDMADVERLSEEVDSGVSTEDEIVNVFKGTEAAE